MSDNSAKKKASNLFDLNCLATGEGPTFVGKHYGLNEATRFGWIILPEHKSLYREPTATLIKGGLSDNSSKTEEHSEPTSTPGPIHLGSHTPATNGYVPIPYYLITCVSISPTKATTLDLREPRRKCMPYLFLSKCIRF
ncbi:hypothetical protein CBL_14009 [Carabus blaptoides fortunei]